MSEANDIPILPEYPEFLKPYLEQIRAKIPADWGESSANKGGGWRWNDPDDTGNGV